tara:strand:+ start:1693 stop:4107 length:2415 start_codon:yes stop_codon:yes gene_type:complete
MGQINVKGLGVVNIEGNAPTKAESEKIKEALNTLNTEIVGNTVGETQGQEYADGPNFGRIATEVAGSIAGSIAAGGFTLPGLARVVGMRSLPFLKALAKASAGSAAGGAGGAVVAETFDPSENVAKEIARAAGEGALGEAVGAPLAIKAAPIIQKILGVAKPRQFAETLQGAEIAEKTLKNKSYEILYGKEAAETLIKLDPVKQLEALKGMTPNDKFIKEYMQSRGIKPDDFANLKRDAIEAQKGLTPAFKTNSQAINIAETIVSKSILGGGQFADRYRALKTIGDKVAYDTVQDLTQGSLARNKSEVGNLFLQMFNNANRLFRQASDTMYQKVDDLLGEGKTRPALSIFEKVGTKNSLSETVAQLAEDMRGGLGSGRRNKLRETIEDLTSDLNKFADPTGGNGLVSYKQLAKIRSDVAADRQVLKTQGVPKDDLFQLEKVIKTMDDMMSPDFLRKSNLNPKAADALEDAKIFYEQGMDVFARGTTVALLAKGARETADLGSVFKSITDGEKTDLLGRVLNDIEQLPTLTKNPAFKEAIGNSITKQEANTLRESLRGHYLQNMLAKSFTEDVQFGGFYNIRKFTNALDNNQETLKLLFKSPDDIKKIEKLKTTLGFAQGKISDISGIPGGVLIQLKQAGAAGQLLQFGGGLLSPANIAVGGAAAAGGVIPALGVLIAPKYIGKAMLDPKFQKLAFEAAVDPIIKKENTPRKMQSVYNQMLGRLVTLGIIPKSEADDFKSVVESQIRDTEKRLESQAVPLPSVEPSNFPVIETGAGVTGAPNTQLASALNLFNKGGIVSAKKVNT